MTQKNQLLVGSFFCQRPRERLRIDPLAYSVKLLSLQSLRKKGLKKNQIG